MEDKKEIYIDSFPNISPRCRSMLLENGITTLSKLKEYCVTGKIKQLKLSGKNIMAEVDRLARLSMEEDIEIRIPVADYFDGSVRFLKYCDDNGIVYIDELSKITFHDLYSIDNFQAKKRQEVIGIFADLEAKGLMVRDRSLVEEPRLMFEKTNPQLLDLDISILKYLGVPTKPVKWLKDSGMKVIGELCPLTELDVLAKVKKEFFDSFKEVSETLTLPINEIIRMYLETQETTRDFQILLYRSEGKTLQQIADGYGVKRQFICNKENAYLKTLDLYLKPFIDLALEKKGFITKQQMDSMFEKGSYNAVITYWAEDREAVRYYDFAEVYLPGDMDEKKITADLMMLTGKYVGDDAGLTGFRYIITEKLKELGYEYFDCDSFVRFLLANGYKQYKDHIVSRRLKNGDLCMKVVAGYFKNGIKLYDADSLMRLRELVELEYGDIGLDMSDDSLSKDLSYSGIYCGRGAVIAPEMVRADKDMLEKIKQYIDSYPDDKVYYADIFNANKELITSSSTIDNHYYLHGVLKYFFKDEYIYSDRDYLTKK